jgi:general secretion pathway protein B
MSILLEALKKSERQRQLGQTPTLDSQSDDQAFSKRSMNHWIPISLVALSAIVIAWFGWQQFREPGTGIVMETAEEVVQSGEQPAPRIGTEPSPPGTQEEDGRIRPGLMAGRTRGEDRAKLNRSFSEYEAESQDRVPVAQAGGQEENTRPAPLQPADNPPVKQDESLSQRAAEPRDQPPVRPVVKSTRPEPAAEGPGRSKLKPHISEPISFWALPQGVRDALPEIKITVLVYAENPEDRFLLTNGQRLVEKEELQSGIVLDEIRRDGAVFLYRNYRFLIKG